MRWCAKKITKMIAMMRNRDHKNDCDDAQKRLKMRSRKWEQSSIIPKFLINPVKFTGFILWNKYFSFEVSIRLTYDGFYFSQMSSIMILFDVQLGLLSVFDDINTWISKFIKSNKYYTQHILEFTFLRFQIKWWYHFQLIFSNKQGILCHFTQ